MFGRGRFNAGVLIEPTDPYKFDPADQSKLIAYRNAIWYVAQLSRKTYSASSSCRPTVEKMNDYAPQYSRIFKEVRESSIEGYVL